jgi:hypothetical protein
MTVRHIAHQLTCADCAAAIQGNPPQPVSEDHCGLIFNEDQDPPVYCPHPKDGDSYWCEFHGEAMGEQIKLEGEADGLTAIIAYANRRIATARARARLRAHERALEARRSRGAPAAEIIAMKVQREELTTAIARAVASKAELEARLDILRPPGRPGSGVSPDERLPGPHPADRAVVPDSRILLRSGDPRPRWLAPPRHSEIRSCSADPARWMIPDWCSSLAAALTGMQVQDQDSGGIQIVLAGIPPLALRVVTRDQPHR